MFSDQRDCRRWLYRFLPAKHPAFYPARRRGLDHWATRGGFRPIAEAQKTFLLGWISSVRGTFCEWDAGDGIIGSHAIWLEEIGWKGFSIEERPIAAQLLQKNRPTSFTSPADAARTADKKIDLISARRDGSIRRVVERVVAGQRPNWVILQARDPRPEAFVALTRAGYRLDHFIHDDEYYRWKGGKT